MPYANALAIEEAEIDLCPPGGVPGLIALAGLLNKDPNPFIASMESKSKPPMLAVIREAECIGCTKCIQACPVDAILGSAKQMHTVIQDECTGCELCVAPCPVDCIDMIPMASDSRPAKADYYRMRFNAREERLKQTIAPVKKTAKSASVFIDKKSYILAAMERIKLKKSSGKATP